MPITNRTALVGSRYPVFVSAQYDDGPVHQAVVAQGIVSVVGTESFFTRYRRFAVGARRERRARLAGRGPPPGDSLTAPFAAVMIAR